MFSEQDKIDALKELKDKFVEIKRMNWIEAVSNGFGAGGETFESLLNIERNELSLADYKGVEIKTRNTTKRSHFSLFSLTPMGIEAFETQRIKNKFGYPDKDFDHLKIFNVGVYYNYYKTLPSDYIVTFGLSKDEKKISLLFYDLNMELIDDHSFWDVDDILKVLENKFSYLFLVYCDYKKTDGIVYYRYRDYRIFKFKGIESFIKAIKKGRIRINFKVGLFKGDYRYLETKDRGTSFEIKNDYITDIFDEITNDV